jgi:hypothetical protein
MRQIARFPSAPHDAWRAQSQRTWRFLASDEETQNKFCGMKMINAGSTHRRGRPLELKIQLLLPDNPVNESKAIQPAKGAADEVGCPWEPGRVAATRHKAHASASRVPRHPLAAAELEGDRRPSTSPAK